MNIDYQVSINELMDLDVTYVDNYEYFSEYLDGSRPFLKEHYFQVHYWKQWLKRMLKKV